MLHFVTSYMNQNKSYRQTLESAQYGLEISFSLIVEHDFFWKIVPYWVYFSQDEDFKLTKELTEKVQYSHNQAIKNGLNEAILLM